MSMQMQNVKGFKDYLPAEAIKRQSVVGKIVEVFKKFGFDPLETPTLEYAEVLEGKYGEEEKLIYKFETPGGDRVALKYDQTVPLARVIAQYGPLGEQKIQLPFKRFQIQSAFRGENTQKGRYREFLQCDPDIVGVDSALADAEILALAYEIYRKLGLDIVIKINDRSLLAEYEPKFLAAVDKLKKIGETGVMTELTSKGYPFDYANKRFTALRDNQETPRLKEARELFAKMGYPAEVIEFENTLVRGLDYYTGIIMEVVLKSDPNSSSLGGGGRYDKMIGRFIGQDYPAVGFSVGVDRTVEAMEEKGLLFDSPTQTQVLVTNTPESLDLAIEAAKQLREADIPTEIWLDPSVGLDKQFKYADKKKIRYVVKLEGDNLVVKDLENPEGEKISVEDLIKKLS